MRSAPWQSRQQNQRRRGLRSGSDSVPRVLETDVFDVHRVENKYPDPEVFDPHDLGYNEWPRWVQKVLYGAGIEVKCHTEADHVGAMWERRS